MNEASCRRLRDLFQTRAVSFGRFILASGQESNYYINSKKVLFHSEAITLLAEAVWELTRDLDITALGGLEVGAIPLVTAAALRYHQCGHELEGFFVRKRAKNHGTRGLIEGVLPPGARVAVVDDVLTTGDSALRAIQEVERAGGRVSAVVCVVDRLEGAREVLAPKYYFRPIFTTRDFGIGTGS